MTERHAFLTAIRENPDEDLPRLVYADWLEDHGEPERAELIRLECQMMRIQEETGRPAPPEMHKDRKRLLPSFRSAIPEPKGGVLSLHNDRGLLVDVGCPWAWWREHGDAIWEQELPWRVRLTTAPADNGDGIEYVGCTSKTLRHRIAGRIVAMGRRMPPYRDFRLLALAARWPGIDFELPPAELLANRVRRPAAEVAEEYGIELPPVREEGAFDEAGYVVDGRRRPLPPR